MTTIHFMHGFIGSGKTTIATTCMQHLNKLGYRSDVFVNASGGISNYWKTKGEK